MPGLSEVRKLRRLMIYSINRIRPNCCSFDKKISPPTSIQQKFLVELFLSGFGDQIAQRVSGTDQYKVPHMEDPVTIHPHSGTSWLHLILFREINFSTF